MKICDDGVAFFLLGILFDRCRLIGSVPLYDREEGWRERERGEERVFVERGEGAHPCTENPTFSRITSDAITLLNPQPLAGLSLESLSTPPPKYSYLLK